MHQTSSDVNPKGCMPATNIKCFRHRARRGRIKFSRHFSRPAMTDRQTDMHLVASIVHSAKHYEQKISLWNVSTSCMQYKIKCCKHQTFASKIKCSRFFHLIWHHRQTNCFCIMHAMQVQTLQASNIGTKNKVLSIFPSQLAPQTNDLCMTLSDDVTYLLWCHSYIIESPAAITN